MRLKSWLDIKPIRIFGRPYGTLTVTIPVAAVIFPPHSIASLLIGCIPFAAHPTRPYAFFQENRAYYNMLVTSLKPAKSCGYQCPLFGGLLRSDPEVRS
jgi:hypothetical protein